MAKITRSNSLSALVEGEPVFGTGTDRFTIGITSIETGITYHGHLTAAEALRFADFVDQPHLRSGLISDRVKGKIRSPLIHPCAPERETPLILANEGRPSF